MDPSKLKREDFSYEANGRGYILRYKGQNIGGAGILSSACGPSGRGVPKQTKDYMEYAENAIQDILAGNPGRMLKEAIEEIDKSEGV